MGLEATREQGVLGVCIACGVENGDKKEDDMKTLMRYLFVSAVSLGIGGVLGWKAFSCRIKRRVAPFDRAQFGNMLIDLLEYQPIIDFHFSPAGNTFRIRGGEPQTIEEGLDRQLARIASFSTSFWFVASFNRDATVQQIRDIDARITGFGFSKLKTLIEDDSGNQTEEGGRVFNEIRIGTSMDFYRHNIEWCIDAEQEATTRQKRR